MCLTLLFLSLNIFLVVTASRDVSQIGPFPDSHSYVAHVLEMTKGNFTSIPWIGELGQSSEPDGKMHPSRWGAGFPLSLLPLVLLFGSDVRSVLIGSAVISLLLVFVSTYIAMRVSGWTAAALIAGFWSLSPFIPTMSRIVMSDALIALLAVVVFALIWRLNEAPAPSPRTSLVTLTLGLVLGLGLLINFRMIILAIAAVFGLRGLRSLTLLTLSMVPGFLLLLVYQWAAFGDPLMNGYDYYLPGVDLFVASKPFIWDGSGDGPWVVSDRMNGFFFQWTCPCPYPGAGVMHHTPPILSGPATLLGLYWVFSPPLVSIAGLWWVAEHWRQPVARFTLVLIILNLLVFSFSLGQAVRYLAPSAAVLLIVSVVQISKVVNSSPRIRKFLDSPW